MKIVMTPDELMDFTTNGRIPESAKKTLAGGVLAMCSSPEMMTAIMTKIESNIRTVMSAAIKVQSNGYGSNGSNSLKGWAADIMLTELTNKAKELDIKDAILVVVAEEVRKRFDAVLLENIRAIIATEYKGMLLARAERYEFEPMIKAKVREALAGVLAQ